MPTTASQYLFEEVKLIQGVINRMGNNSFLIKGWAVTLIVATFLFKGSNSYPFVAFLPWIVFWFLDAYFVRIEKLYRELFDWVVLNRRKSREFLIDLRVQTVEKRFGKNIESIPKIMISNTLGTYYGFLLLLIILAITLNFLIA